MKKLVDEHALIKRWTALIPEVIKNLDVELKESHYLIKSGHAKTVAVIMHGPVITK